LPVGVCGDTTAGEDEREDQLVHGNLDDGTPGTAKAIVERAWVVGKCAGDHDGSELLRDGGSEFLKDDGSYIVRQECDSGARVKNGGLGKAGRC
jgi:hypothetical protein